VRSLIADLDGIVWEADATTMTFSFVSEGATELLGYAPHEWLADDAFWADHLHPDDRERVVARFVRVATDGGRFDEEYRFRARDGAWIWLRDLGHAVRDVEDRPALIRGLMVEITDRKAMEAATHEAEDRFRRVVEHLPAIVYLESVVHAPGTPGAMLYVSPQVETILGFSAAEWIADPVAWARQFHPEDRPKLRAEYERIEREGGGLRAEYRMYTRTGEIRWFRDEAALVRGTAGEPLYWQGVMYDITAERESTERAEQSEMRYRSLVEQMPAIVYVENVTDDGLQLMYINSRVEELLGISPEEWVGDPGLWESALHPDDRDRVVAENRASEHERTTFRSEYRLIGRNGRVLWFHDEAILIRDAAGSPAYWQGVMIDITRRREAEAQRAEAEERYRALVEQIPVAVYIDPADRGPTTYMSPQAEQMFGYRPEEWYADKDLWRRIVHPEDQARLDAEPPVDAPVASAYRVLAKDGHTVWVQDMSRLIHDEDGNPKYWQGVLIDVTEQRRMLDLERELERERIEAERLRLEDEMKTTFLQAVSHDLRTPLAAILGLAVTLDRDDVELTEAEERDMARRIAANARKLDGIVTDFLDLERLRRGLATPRLEPIDLGALVREVVAVSELVAERRVALDVSPLQIWADPAMLERILENLLSNAAKHTAPGSQIWVRLERDDEGALLVVEDDGPGVTPDDRVRIFEAFRQGEGAATGSGVGLALVAKFAELHDGRAWVQERPGGGASFRVRLAWRPEVADAEDGDQPTTSDSSADNHA
jgi:PAS domain S-box-containing protein